MIKALKSNTFASIIQSVTYMSLNYISHPTVKFVFCLSVFVYLGLSNKTLPNTKSLSSMVNECNFSNGKKNSCDIDYNHHFYTLGIATKYP